MESPLSFIRRYNKLILALCAGLMIAFLLEMSFDVSGSRGGGGGGYGGEKVVSFKGGTITAEGMQRLNLANDAVTAYLAKIENEARKQNRQLGIFPNFSPITSEDQIVVRIILAQKARELGMSLSNQDIDSALCAVADETVTPEALKKLREKVIKDYLGRISEAEIYNYLRNLILAQYVQAVLYSDAGRSNDPTMASQHLTPVRAWEYYRRVNRKLRVEVMPLQSEAFASTVKSEPSAKEKNELFEKYKTTVPNPTVPDPGFARPHRIAFGYITLDSDRFMEEAKAKISTDQIKASYDAKVKAGDLQVPDLPVSKDEPGNEAKKEGEKKVEEKSESEEKKSETTAEAPKEDAPKSETPAEKTDPPAEKEAGSECPLPDQAEEKATGGEAATPAAGVKKETDSTGEAAKAEKVDEVAPSEKSEDKKAPPKQKMRTRTFEEAKDDIHRELALPLVKTASEAAAKELAQIVKDFGAKHAAWEAEKNAAKIENRKPKGEEPGELSDLLKAAVKKHGVSYSETKPLDQFEIQDVDLGQSFDFQFLPNNFRRFDFYQIAYYSDAKLYDPGTIRSSVKNVEYLYWKTADEPAKVLELKEAEEAVIAAWKAQKSYEAALAAAKDLAAKAEGKTLREAFKDGAEKAGEITESEPFSWLTTPIAFGAGQQQLEISRVSNVKFAGTEFMETVAGLKPGQIGVCSDQPKKTVYVVRLMEESPGEEELRERFFFSGPKQMPIDFQYRSDKFAFEGLWFDEVNKQMAVVWHRPAQPLGR